MSSFPAAKPEVLKVLHVHSGNMIGGIESVLLTLAEFAGTRREFQQEFALAFDGPFADSLRATGATVHILPEVQLTKPFFGTDVPDGNCGYWSINTSTRL